MGEQKSNLRPGLSLTTEDETTVFSAVPSFQLSPPGSPLPSQPFVFVVLDCVHYTAGERVTGEILVSLPLELGASTLVLESVGREEVLVYEAGEGSDGREASNIIYKMEHTIAEFAQFTDKGQFVYPFTFKLPHYCPATFSFQGEDSSGHYMKGFVSYSVTVSLRVKGEDSSHLSHSRPILIHNALSNSPSAKPVDVDHVVTGCCCFCSRGITHLRLSLRSEEHCIVGGNVRFKLDPDNSRCSASIKSITGMVRQEIAFLVPGLREFRHTRTLFSITRATWISTSTSMIYDKDFEYVTELRPGNGDVNPSSNETPLIQSRYYVQCYIYYDVTCRSERALITLPIHVNPKNTFERLEPRLPRLWNPHEHPILNIVAEPSQSYSQSSSAQSSSFPPS